MQLQTLPDDYEKIQKFNANIGGEEIIFTSKPGLSNWQHLSPTTQLLSTLTDLPGQARCLILGSGAGAVAAVMGRRFYGCQQWLMDVSWTALRLAEMTLQANRVENARISPGIGLPSGSAGNFDAVLIELPKGRKLARRWILHAYSALRPRGYLYLAGANDQGIQPAIQDAQQLFANSSILGYKKGCRIARMLKPAEQAAFPDWAGEPGVASNTWVEVVFREPPGLSPLASLPGVFSNDRVDEGSRLLIDTLQIAPGVSVLDLGCGFGLLGLFAAQAGASRVDLIDDNQLAVACALENISRRQMHQAHAFPSDAASEVKTRTYQLVVTNPPFHAGKAVDYLVTQAFIHQSHAILDPGGHFWMVANRFIRYEDVLKKTFGNARCAAETSKFQVWVATKR